MKKRVIIITGASSGMGREMAMAISRRYKVKAEFWLIARRKQRLCRLAEKLQRFGRDSRIICGDLTEDKVYEDLSSLLKKETPEVLMLVNASGFGKIGDFSHMDERDLSGMVDLNCRALTRMCRICIPYIPCGYGHIINFASAAAFCPQPWFSVYAASKSYVLSFSEALSEELSSSGITVTAVCPGPVKTEFFSIAEEKASVPLYKRLFMADPRRVVSLVLKDSLSGRRISIYGFSMKALYILSRVLPTGLILGAIRIINGR